MGLIRVDHVVQNNGFKIKLGNFWKASSMFALILSKYFSREGAWGSVVVKALLY